MQLLSNLTINKSDSVGAWASGLCLIHCIATPFLFVAQTCSATCCASAPGWWSAVDILFIGISGIAVYWSAKNTSENWMKYALWGVWLALVFVIANEKLGWLPLFGGAIFLPAIGLIFLHLYNRRYCQCATDECCATA